MDQVFGLGRNPKGIVEPIQVPVKEARYGWGYDPIDNDEKPKKKKDQALAKTILRLYQYFLVREYAEQEYLGEGICGLFEEIDTIIEEEVELTGFRDAELGEILQN